MSGQWSQAHDSERAEKNHHPRRLLWSPCHGLGAAGTRKLVESWTCIIARLRDSYSSSHRGRGCDLPRPQSLEEPELYLKSVLPHNRAQAGSSQEARALTLSRLSCPNMAFLWASQDTLISPNKNVLFHILQPQSKESSL